MAAHKDTKAKVKTPSKGSPKNNSTAVAVAGSAKSAASEHPKSPLAPKLYPTLPPLAGVRLATGQAGIKYKDRTDVMMAVLAPGSQIAGVFPHAPKPTRIARPSAA